MILRPLASAICLLALHCCAFGYSIEDPVGGQISNPPPIQVPPFISNTSLQPLPTMPPAITLDQNQNQPVHQDFRGPIEYHIPSSNNQDKDPDGDKHEIENSDEKPSQSVTPIGAGQHDPDQGDSPSDGPFANPNSWGWVIILIALILFLLWLRPWGYKNK
jgi:hypothetical protein